MGLKGVDGKGTHQTELTTIMILCNNNGPKVKNKRLNKMLDGIKYFSQIMQLMFTTIKCTFLGIYL